ncbi:hypothetical protein CFELI_00615 [Corynebacterium felinum]|nr:hypothetical protein CFELI_00615 [Corynebacterium felinum]
MQHAEVIQVARSMLVEPFMVLLQVDQEQGRMYFTTVVT